MQSQPVRTTLFQSLCHRCLGDFEPGASHCPRGDFEVDPPWTTAILETLIEHGPEIYCGVVRWITVMTILVCLALIAAAGAGLVM
jgi:hypothetical protein